MHPSSSTLGPAHDLWALTGIKGSRIQGSGRRDYRVFGVRAYVVPTPRKPQSVHATPRGLRGSVVSKTQTYTGAESSEVWTLLDGPRT